MTNKADQAAKYFHGVHGDNCAQAILRVFLENPEVLLEFKKYGGGRAPGNLCGALYAALHLLDDDKSKENLTKDFEQKAGNVSCKEIRKEGKTPCHECVRIAAGLLDNTKK